MTNLYIFFGWNDFDACSKNDTNEEVLMRVNKGAYKCSFVRMDLAVW